MERTRTTWTTVDVRASEVSLDDTVVYDRHTWLVLEGDAFREDGSPLTFGEEHADAALVEVNLVRANAVPAAPGRNVSGTPGDPIGVQRLTRRLLLTPTDLVTIQVPAGRVSWRVDPRDQ